MPLLTGATLLAILMVVAACYSAPPGEGALAQGDTLVIRIDELDGTSELRYPGLDNFHYLVTPNSPDNELLMVRLSIWNDKAINANFTVDEEAAELRGLGINETYTPIDVDSRKVKAEAHQDEELYARPVPGRPGLPNSVQFLTGPVKMLRGDKLSGWMVFEVPKNTEFRELKWKAGDSVFLKF